MTTYETWTDTLMAFHRGEIKHVQLSLDTLFDHPVRYQLPRKQSRLFLLYCIANATPIPTLIRTDQSRVLCITPK